MDDIESASDFAADWILFDAKIEGKYGGTGHSFDWKMLRNYRCSTGWILSGGLNADNITDALGILSPDIVDVSSGVEKITGVKDPAKIVEFVEKVRQNIAA
jgi:phosphoribosylanthranilate isomerase